MSVCAVDGRVGVSEGKGGGEGRMKGNEPIFEWTFLPSMDDAMTSETHLLVAAQIFLELNFILGIQDEP